LQQPTARDMRSLITAIHIAIELERIADHAAGISKLTLELIKQPLIKPLVDIPKMCDISRKMLKDSLDAYVHWNSDLAHEVFKRDDAVDELEKQVYQDLIDLMVKKPKNITGGTYLLWVAHNLERIADRITNICERVIFMVTGELMLE
jgi:phosphate transport system protein